jgi:hypothetical protein
MYIPCEASSWTLLHQNRKLSSRIALQNQLFCLCRLLAVSDEYNIWKSPLGNYKKKTINIYHLLIFNKLLTSSEHRNRNKPFYIYKGLIQWQKADPASSPWPMYMHESNAIHIHVQRSSRAVHKGHLDWKSTKTIFFQKIIVKSFLDKF